jgi:iron complex outermembrane receptor protein
MLILSDVCRAHARAARLAAMTRTATSAVVLLAAMSAMASGAARAADTSPQTAQAPAVEEIVVTGSRIIRDGYEAPTPVTVVSAEQLQDASRLNLADVLNNLPAFQGSNRLASGNQSLSSGQSGASTLNLRGLGPERTLILFDGRRFPPQFPTGVVDTGQFPDALVTRVDVVTGGASAAYGSDAVAGVVNYILDTNFTGVKGTVTGGVTTYGDRRSWKVQLAGGFGFAGDRGHVLLSADASYSDQLRGYQRDWNTVGYIRVVNPLWTANNGRPQLVSQFNAGISDFYGGGLITGGPLKGTAFGAGGVPFQWNYGDPNYLSSTFQVGGNWRDGNMMAIASMSPESTTHHMFNRISYDLTDRVQVFAEYLYADGWTTTFCCYQYYHGNLTIKADNAFLPASVAAQMTALKLASAPFGKTVRDLPAFGAHFDRMSHVFTVGAKGDFDAADTKWTWNAYYNKGVSKIDGNAPQSNVDRFALAIDAVRAPNGAIVCRSTLTDPTNGCVPYNLFGLPIADGRPTVTPGVNSQAALNYITGGGDPHISSRLARDTLSVDVNGEPFSSWAGPVSLALGVEWRKDSLDSVPDALSIARKHYSTNFALPFAASNTVTEGFIETVVPLARQTAWAESLDFNGAARFTGYANSGFVDTWKAGLTYNPVSDVRFRVTQSRDIRAPNLNELAAAPATGRTTSLDPFFGNQSFPRFTITVGNPNLVPEKADTTGLGVVYQPSWFHGFSASVDYFRINVKGIIASLDAQTILNLCYAGQQSMCALVTRLAPAPGQALGVLDSILQQPLNQNSQLVKGVDFETSYRTRLDAIVNSWRGDLSVRAIATKTINDATNTGTITIDRAGDNGASVPTWSASIFVSYTDEALRVSWTGRYISAGHVDNTYVECQTTCPSVIPPGFTTIDNNHVDSNLTQDLTIAYRFRDEGTSNAEAFLTVNNLFNTQPPYITQTGNAYSPHTNPVLYDVVGREFHVGVRFKM